MNARYWFVAFSFLFLGLLARGQNDVYSYLPDNFDELEYEEQFHILDTMRRSSDRPYEINVGISLLGMNLGEAANDPKGVAQWATMASRLYGNTGLYSEAFNFGLMALENAKKANSLEFEVQALTRLGRTKMDLQDYKEAVLYAEKAVEKSRSLPDSISENRGWALNMVGEINRMSGDLEKAMGYYDLAFAEFESQGVDAGMEAITHNIGLAEVARGNYERGWELLHSEMDTYIAYDPVRKMEYSLAISDLLEQTSNADKAIEMAKEGMEFADSINNLRWKVKFLDQMAKLERNRKNWEAAWDLREEAIAISEDVLGEKVRRQSEILDVRFDLKKP